MKSYHEFIAEMGKTEERQLESRLTVLIEHLLKIKYVTGQVGDYNRRGWNKTLRSQRDQVVALIGKNPSLKAELTHRLLDRLYRSALSTVGPEFVDVSFPPTRQLSLEDLVGPEILARMPRLDLRQNRD